MKMNWNKAGRKLLKGALILALAMTLGAAPLLGCVMTARAEELSSGTYNSSSRILNSDFTVNNNVTISGNNNPLVTLYGNTSITIADGKTLDVNGRMLLYRNPSDPYTLTINGSGTMNVTAGDNSNAITGNPNNKLIINGAAVTVSNNSSTISTIEHVTSPGEKS